MDTGEITEPVAGKRPSQRWRVSARAVGSIAVVLIVIALAATLALPERRRVIRYPSGPIAAITLPPGFRLQGNVDPPRSIVARNGNSLEFQVLTADTGYVGVDRGPLSKIHLAALRAESPDIEQQIELNGFAWELQVSHDPLPQMIAVAYAEGTTVGVIGTGPWSLDDTLAVLGGIRRRTEIANDDR